MSNQELQNRSNTKEDAGVDKRRRFIKGAGIAAPVVLTLSSPSVFGNILCGSEIISGNESQIVQGSCTSGNSPATWSGLSWPSPYSNSPNNNTHNCTSNAGTKFNDLFNGFPAAGIIPGPVDNRAMSQILCSYIGFPGHPPVAADKLKAYLIAALLNAANSTTYPLDVGDVKAIQAGTRAVPTNPIQIPANPNDVMTYLEATW